MNVTTEGPHGSILMNVATEHPRVHTDECSYRGSSWIHTDECSYRGSHGSILMNISTEDP